MKPSFLEPFTGFGFWKLFIQEESRTLLVDFLNSLLHLESPIVEIRRLEPEDMEPRTFLANTSYHFLCSDQVGQSFIVALQKEKMDFYKRVEEFASCFPILEKIKDGCWSGKLAANSGPFRVYLVGILGFVFKENCDSPDYLYRVNLVEQGWLKASVESLNERLDERSALVYVELPKFTKIENELVSLLDKWLYLLKHLSEFSKVPDVLSGSTAAAALQAVKYSDLTENEAWSYEMSLKHYRDLLNVVETAYQQAFEEGRKQGEAQAARQVVVKMLNDGISSDVISEYLGLPVDDIRKLNATPGIK